MSLNISTRQALLTAGARWNHDGTRIYYVDAASRKLMEVAVQLGSDPKLSPPVPLFGEDASNLNLSRGFDVSPDGSRFLAVRATTPRGGDRGGLILVRNWALEFEQDD